MSRWLPTCVAVAHIKILQHTTCLQVVFGKNATNLDHFSGERARNGNELNGFFSILHCVAVRSAVFVVAALILASRLSVRFIRETHTKVRLLGGRAAA
jgi:hypothetical protein